MGKARHGNPQHPYECGLKASPQNGQRFQTEHRPPCRGVLADATQHSVKACVTGADSWRAATPPAMGSWAPDTDLREKIYVWSLGARSQNPWDVLNRTAKKGSASFIATFSPCSQFLEWLKKSIVTRIEPLPTSRSLH